MSDNNFTTGDQFSNELFEELMEGGAELAALYAILSGNPDCDFDGVPGWLREQATREAVLNLREKNVSSTYSKRAATTFYVNDETEATPSGSSRFILDAPVSTLSTPVNAKAIPFKFVEDANAAFTLNATDPTTITVPTAGIYRVQFSGRLAAFLNQTGAEIFNSAQNQPSAVFTAVANATATNPVDIVIQSTLTGTSPSRPTRYKTLASTGFLLTDYQNNRTRSISGNTLFRLEGPSTLKLTMQRRRSQGNFLFNNITFREAIGLIKEPFTTTGSLNPLLDASNYFSIIRVA